MKTHLLIVPLLCGAVSSCDKVKEVASEVKAKTEQKVAEVTSGKTSTAANTPPPADARLQALVDQTAEGVVFRKDLPFPTQLDVVVTTRQTFKNVLAYSSSELGRQSERKEGTLAHDTTLQRAGERVVLTIGKKTLTRPNPENPEEPFVEIVPDGKSGKSLALSLSGGKWQPEAGNEFQSRVWADEIKGHGDDLLIEAGVLPRTLWFGKKRLKIGDPVPLPQNNLPVLFDPRGIGKATLVLESIEPLNGHPCGVFTITGDYSIKNYQDFDGSKADMEMTIQSGKVWMSLLYPVVLKEELDAIQTLTSSVKGGLTTRTSGGLTLSIERKWTTH